MGGGVDRERGTSRRGTDVAGAAATARTRARARALRARRRARARPAGRGGRRRRPLPRRGSGEACRGRRRNPPRDRGGVAAGWCRGGREESRCAGGVAARRSRAFLRDPDLERGRARVPAAPRQPADRGHRHERQDDHDGAARRDPPPPTAAASRRPATSAARSADVAESIEPGTWVVCELSSFQLEDVHTFACDVAVLLNLEPDHLDRHGTFEAYRDAKLRIFERARTKVVPRGLGLEGSSSRPTTRCPRSR